MNIGGVFNTDEPCIHRGVCLWNGSYTDSGHVCFVRKMGPRQMNLVINSSS